MATKGNYLVADTDLRLMSFLNLFIPTLLMSPTMLPWLDYSYNNFHIMKHTRLLYYLPSDHNIPLPVRTNYWLYIYTYPLPS